MASLILLGVAFLSALVPVVNLEVYLGGVAVLGETRTWWEVAWLGAVAAVGQMAGKTLFYYLGRGVLTLPRWFRPKNQETADPSSPTPPSRTAVRMARWRQRIEDRPWLSGVFVGASASTGLPPFALVSVAAGALRVPLAVFLIAGLLGRWARFATVLAVVQVAGG